MHSHADDRLSLAGDQPTIPEFGCWADCRICSGVSMCSSFASIARKVTTVVGPGLGEQIHCAAPSPVAFNHRFASICHPEARENGTIVEKIDSGKVASRPNVVSSTRDSAKQRADDKQRQRSLKKEAACGSFLLRVHNSLFLVPDAAAAKNVSNAGDDNK